jgi:hypothetical protein
MLKEEYRVVEASLLEKFQKICELWSLVEAGQVSSCDVMVRNKSLLIRSVNHFENGLYHHNYAEIVMEWFANERKVFECDDYEESPEHCVELLYKEIHQLYFGFSMDCLETAFDPIKYTPVFLIIQHKVPKLPSVIIELVLDYNKS